MANSLPTTDPTIYTKPARRERSYGEGALRRATDEIALSSKSDRHLRLYAAAAGIGSLIAGGVFAGREDRAVGCLVSAGMARGGHEAEVRRTVNDAIRRGSQTPRKCPTEGQTYHDATDARLAVMDYWDTLTTTPAPNGRWATTIKILAALTLEALAVGKTEVNLSHRQLAEAAGVSNGTIHKHLAAMNAWAVITEKGDRLTGTATTWRLLCDRRASGPNKGTDAQAQAWLVPNARGINNPNHNLWHRWSGGWATYSKIAGSDQPATLEAIATSVGRSKRSLPRILRRLEDAGLIERFGDGWIASTTTDVQVEDLDGCGYDHRAMRRLRHRAERIAWRASADRQRYALECHQRRAPLDRRSDQQ